MNNNRNNNNNRRRGRGNRQQQGGGNQNRIDSRARGNAPQMFDKYKKLAQDAAHNGDRVQAEYYLQFADHYFRVIADNKSRQDEQRGGGRRDERDFGGDDYGEDGDFDAPGQQQAPYERQNDRQNERPIDRPNDRQRQRPRRDERDDDNRARGEGEPGFEGDEATDFDPAENPFVRPSRDRGRDRPVDGPRDNGRDGKREGESRRGRGPRRDTRAPNEADPVDNAGEIDAAALPPSFSASVEAAEEDAAPKRKLPPRRRRTPAGEVSDDGESLKAVG